MENFISYLPKNQTLYFSGSDQEKLFRKNLKRSDKDWIYRTKEIEYSYNEYGFREKSFNDVDWQNSIVMFGCSNVQGIGLAKEDTIARQLENIMQIPVVNLGIGGSSIDIACWNSTVLHEYYPRPRAVVQVWSSLNRYADVTNHRIRSYLPQLKSYYARIDWEYRSKRYVQTDRALWKNKTVYYEASFFTDTAKKLDTDEFSYNAGARDLMHPGIESNRFAAEKIAENLQKQGL